MKKTIVASAAFAIAVSAAGLAQAGGFSRGTADTDILYEDGNVALRGSGTFVSASRAFETIGGRPGGDGDMLGSYWIPGAAAKIRISDSFSCAATYTQPFGASIEYGAQAIGAQLLAGRNATIGTRFDTDEYGATCAVRFAADKGNVYLLGGVFLQSIDYREQSYLGTLHLTDQGYGYRLGAAYDLPEYALRAQLLYRSAVDHDADGDFTVSTAGAARFRLPLGTGIHAYGGGTLPQSLELSLRSGIAPDWLAFGSVKWTDWSVLPTLDYTVSGIGAQRKVFNFKDGWTVQAGVAHNFTETVAGLLSLTWDRGVSSGADTLTDTWTLGAGAQFKTEVGTFRVNAGLSYLTAGEQSVAQGANFDASVGRDWSLGVNTSYLIKF